MAKLILSALLRPRRDGVQAQVAEFPDIKVSSWSIAGALALGSLATDAVDTSGN
jgi:hypothetical protein